MVSSLLCALLFTILIELAMLWLLTEWDEKTALASVGMNVLTNVPLNLFVFWVDDSWLTILVGEVLVVMVETLIFFHYKKPFSRAFIISLLCNATSYFVGLLFTLALFLQVG